MYVSEPGTYKLVFDNTYSWFTNKNIRYRSSILKPSTPPTKLTENIEEEEPREVVESINEVKYENNENVENLDEENNQETEDINIDVEDSNQ